MNMMLQPIHVVDSPPVANRKKSILEHRILFALRFILDISPLQVIKIKKLHLH